MASFTRWIYRGRHGSWETDRHATDLGTSPAVMGTSRRRGPMTGGRWSSQTRFIVVLIGLALVGLGVFTTITYHSNSGAAALVAGGVLAVLVGVSGGAAVVVRSAEQETRVASAGKAQLVGDAEGAFDRFVQLLRGYAPQAIEYHEAANTALYEAAGREGQKLQPIFGYFLGPIAMSGSLIVVDIRAGTGFSIARMQTTYQALLVGSTAPFNAALVIVNGGPDEPILRAVNELSTALDRPVVAVSWRLGDNSDAIAETIVRILREIERLGLDKRSGSIDAAAVERDALALFEPAQQGYQAGPGSSGYQPVGYQPAAASQSAPPAQAGYQPPAQASYQPAAQASYQPAAQASYQPAAQAGYDAGSSQAGFGAAPAQPGYEAAPAQTSYQPAAAPAQPARRPSPRPQSAPPASSAQGGYQPPAQPAQPDPEQYLTQETRLPAQVPVLVGEIDTLDHPEEWPNPEPRRRPQPPPRIYDDSASWQRATDLHWRGQLQEAEEAYREIVDARAHALGWDHPDTLTARDQHATVLRDLDRLAEALVECDEVLTARTRILGEDHPDTLTSRSHLATIYHQLGDLTRAETEHQRVMEARTRVLGANHQETLISRSNLAKVYQDM